MSSKTLRPSDVAVAFQLLLTPRSPYADLARSLHLSVGETHNAVKRLTRSGLVGQRNRLVATKAFYEFLVSGVPYVFPAELGPETRGVPTAHAADPLAKDIVSDEAVVWPSSKGSMRGQSVSPLYPGAPDTAEDNRELYRLLALTDALRMGRARERGLAKEYLRKAVLDPAA